LNRLVKSFGVEQNRHVYGNFKVESPDGILMFRCGEKKINWYLKRSLAEYVNENTIRLNFTPNGLGNHQRDFGLTQMKNHCVCCGTTDYLTRHHVVPICYRKYFPLDIKSHNFHDVLLMCVECHDTYERKADELKKQLSLEYKAPINGELETKGDLVKYVKIATTLVGDTSNIPQSRIQFLRGQIKSYFGIKKLTQNKIDEISKSKSTIIRKTHGEIVVSQLKDIQNFVELWREHFINSNDCKYLPENWSVKNVI